MSDDAPKPGAEPAGEDFIRAAVEGAPEAEAPPVNGDAGGDNRDGAELPPCPVTPLGRRDGTYSYLSPAGELRHLTTREHTKLGILSLFDGDATWPRAAYPAFDRDGKATGGWNAEAAAAWLMRACATAGIFDSATASRGPGVWRDETGGLIVHAGDALQLDGTWSRAGVIRDGAIYVAAPPVPRPAEMPAEKEQGRALLDAVRLWRFEREIDAELTVGFIGAAMLGGAPAWRAHMLTIGRRGTGKSWLADLIAAAVGGGARSANNVTEAGIRQALTGEARTIILDESESEEHTAHRIASVIGLLRLMSSGAGARVMRGSAGGKAQAFSVTGCAYLAAILPPVLKPQDRSRITVVRLKSLPSGQEHAGAAERALAAIVAAKGMSAGLRARAIDGWTRFLDTFAAYRSAFMAHGCDPRDADRIATLLAGRDLLAEDHVPDSDTLDEEVARFVELVEEAHEQEDEGEGQECLSQLMTSPVDLWRNGERRQVSELVMEALSLETSSASARREIQKIGLRVADPGNPEGRKYDPSRADFDGRQCVLLVANRHVGLERIFNGSRWGSGGHQAALRYLPGARAWPQTVAFAGARQRATAIPINSLPRPEEDD